MIPFNRPGYLGTELDYVRRALEGGHTSAKGPASERAGNALETALGAESVLLTTSCTAALEMSAMLLDLKPGDRVIVPSFTFVSTALAFAREGAELVFADIEDRTLGIDPVHVESLVDERTRAVVPVHYAGVPCDLDGLQQVLAPHPHVDVIEDNAHGLFGAHRCRPLGSFGRFSTLSFHETKNFVCGEGGALVLNNPDDVARAHVLYDKGTNRRSFMLGQVDKYSWVDTGSSFGMSDLLAAFLSAQLDAKDEILRRRKRVFDRYERNLGPHAEALGFRTPVVPEDATCAYHMFYLLLPDQPTRDHVLTALSRSGFHATFHYVPLHDARGAVETRAFETACPVTTSVSGRLLRLPFFNDLSTEDVDRISECVIESLTVTTQ
jgi:dTDP-4-amino-4,6-dideoxygalactose transaminase